MLITMPTIAVAVTTAIVASPMTWEQAVLIMCAIILAMVVDYLRFDRRDFDDSVLPLLLVAAARRKNRTEMPT